MNSGGVSYGTATIVIVFGPLDPLLDTYFMRK